MSEEVDSATDGDAFRYMAQRQISVRDHQIYVQQPRGSLASSPSTNSQFEHLSSSPSGLSALGAHSVLEGLLQKLQERVRHSLADPVTPVRLASHFSVLAVAALVLFLSQVEMPTWMVSLRLFPTVGLGDNSAATHPASSHLIRGIGTQIAIFGDEALQRATVPLTVAHEEPESEKSIGTYIVQSGDTILAIAEKFGIQPETIMWSNSSVETNADLIRPGDELKILPVNGVLHTVTSGDTLISLAAKYKIAVEDILNFRENKLADASASLVVGSQLVLPGATKTFVTQPVNVSGYIAETPDGATKGSGAFAWPTAGSINQGYYSGHPALDIGSWEGAPVKAADAGFVVLATGGWNGGYGNHVIVDHGNGFATLYAHLNSIFVYAGESVSRGQQIGSVGMTGNSTGAHLHFEIRYQGVPRNPFNYLP